jgi:hypothetical protein
VLRAAQYGVSWLGAVIRRFLYAGESSCLMFHFLAQRASWTIGNDGVVGIALLMGAESPLALKNGQNRDVVANRHHVAMPTAQVAAHHRPERDAAPGDTVLPGGHQRIAVHGEAGPDAQDDIKAHHAGRG